MSVEESLVTLCIFLAAVHLLTFVAPFLRQSPIPFHIILGAALGPPLANFAPVPDGLSLAGSLGLYLSVLHTGLTTDFATARRDLPRALLVATVGLAVPFGLGVLTIYIWHARHASNEATANVLSTSTLRAALATGAAISPTSLGVVAELLAATPSASGLGTLIALAAVLDDVEALVLLAEVRALGGDSSSPWRLIRPVAASAGCVLAAGLLAATLGPSLLARLARLSERLRVPGFHAGLCAVLAVAAAAGYATTAAGSSGVLAVYATGVAFARGRDETVASVWERSVAPVERWIGPLFFAATIGFSVPLAALVDGGAVAAGAGLACAAVFGKLCCGLVMAPRWVDGVGVGVAMLGRGEFGFLIAASARAEGLLTETELGAVTWGIVVPTVLAPGLFVLVFRWREERQRSNSNEDSSLGRACGDHDAGVDRDASNNRERTGS